MKLLSSRHNRRLLYLLGVGICGLVFWRYGDPFYLGRGSSSEKFLTSAPVAFITLFLMCIFQEPE